MAIRASTKRDMLLDYDGYKKNPEITFVIPGLRIQ